MKQRLSLIVTLLFIVGNITTSSAQSVKKTVKNSTVSNKVEVYYFHFTRRCNTCMSVESTAKKALETLYPDKVKKGVYTFTAMNLDEDKTKPIAEKLGVGGQTLLVVCGQKKTDLTDKAFMNAHDLEKMKTEINKAIENLTAK